MWFTNFCFLNYISINVSFEVSSCDKKFLSVTRNFLILQNIFLWQEISYCGKKFRSVARHFFLRKVSVFDNIFALENLFFLQESICLTGTFCFILQKILSCKICDKNAWISANISCEPGSLAPGEYSTLA